MRDLTITIIQADQVWEDIQANLHHYDSLISKIDSTDIIVLPEMFQTAFSMNTSLAEEMNGISISWLKRIAAKKNAAIYTSLMISENDMYYNRGVFVFPNGDLRTYDKRKTFGLAKESDHFKAGNAEQIVSWKGWDIQLQICYDLRFPEIVRNKIHENGNPAYDLILYVANWPEKRSTHWNALLKARAIENQSYVVGVNRVGTDYNDFNYSGNSQIINANGHQTSLPIGTESCESYVLIKDELRKIRKVLPFLGDR
jgi:predicted amidohydrolase